MHELQEDRLIITKSLLPLLKAKPGATGWPGSPLGSIFLAPPAHRDHPPQLRENNSAQNLLGTVLDLGFLVVLTALSMGLPGLKESTSERASQLCFLCPSSNTKGMGATCLLDRKRILVCDTCVLVSQAPALRNSILASLSLVLKAQQG